MASAAAILVVVHYTYGRCTFFVQIVVFCILRRSINKNQIVSKYAMLSGNKYRGGNCDLHIRHGGRWVVNIIHSKLQSAIMSDNGYPQVSQ